MTGPRTPIGTLWALRSAALLVTAVVAVGTLPAVAEAATPPPATDTTSAAVPTTAAPRSSAPGEPGRRVTVTPTSQTVRDGAPVILTASDAPPDTAGSPVTIRWQRAPAPAGPWTDIGGPGGAVLTATATPAMDGAVFRAVAATAEASWTSPPAVLHVRPVPGPPATTSPVPAGCVTAAVGPGATCPGSTRPPVTPSSGATSTTPAPAVSTPAGAATASPIGAAVYGTVALPVVRLGRQQTATGHNFTPGTLVHVALEPEGIDLGTSMVAPDGTVTTTFGTSGLLAGPHTVTWTPV